MVLGTLVILLKIILWDINISLVESEESDRNIERVSMGWKVEKSTATGAI